MNLLINEMLETARLEEGGPITNLEPVDLRDIIRRAAQTMEPLARGQPIRVTMPDDPSASWPTPPVWRPSSGI